MYSLKAWYVSSIMHSFLATDLFLTVRALKISLPLQGKCCCATCCYWRGPCWQLAHQWSSVFPWATSGITIANCIFQLLGQRFFVQEAYQVVLLGSTSVTNWRVQEWVKGDLTLCWSHSQDELWAGRALQSRFLTVRGLPRERGCWL